MFKKEKVLVLYKIHFLSLNEHNIRITIKYLASTTYIPWILVIIRNHGERLDIFFW